MLPVRLFHLSETKGKNFSGTNNGGRKKPGEKYRAGHLRKILQRSRCRGKIQRSGLMRVRRMMGTISLKIMFSWCFPRVENLVRIFSGPQN